MSIIGNPILIGSGGGGGSSKPTYLISNGDSVSKFYFNTGYDLDSYLSNLTYDQTMQVLGFDLNWCYIGFYYLCAVDLSFLVGTSTYLLFWGESGYDPIYSTTAFDLSGYGYVAATKGWNATDITPGSAITVDTATMATGFADIMDYVVAKDSVAFGGAGSLSTVDISVYEYEGEAMPSDSIIIYTDGSGVTHQEVAEEKTYTVLENSLIFVGVGSNENYLVGFDASGLQFSMHKEVSFVVTGYEAGEPVSYNGIFATCITGIGFYYTIMP